MTPGEIAALPKTELHVHIEGTLEPEMMFDLAARNDFELPFPSIDEVRAAYRFTDLQSFLDIYYQGAAVLQTPDDFRDLMSSYLEKASRDGVRHAEIFFDPQSHTERGVGYPVMMQGFREAMSDAAAGLGISSDLILCFLRHLSGEDAVRTLREAEPHLEGVIAVGLDSSEKGRPPELFEEAYSLARELGLRTVAHAGEEGPPSYVVGALDVLGVERVDHGVRSLEDEEVVRRLRTERVPLTVCPLSNVALKVVPSIAEHPIVRLMEEEVLVTVNSDDPAYFGGYVADNYRALVEGIGLGESALVQLARNSITASFLDDGRKQDLLEELESSVASTGDQSELT